MNRSVIEELYDSNNQILNPILMGNDLSTYNQLNDRLKKVLLMSAASYFETVLVNGILDTVSERSNKDILIKSFVENKAIKRQYHTLFNWEAGNCNGFLALFGQEFKDTVQQEINQNEISQKVKSFLELGNLRNQLVHKNVAAFTLEKTSEEIFSLFIEAHEFVDYIIEKLKTH